MIESLVQSPATSNNRFVLEFILPESTNLLNLKGIEEEIGFERSSWQNSGAAEQFAGEYINLFDNYGVSHLLSTPKGHNQFLANLRNGMYGHATVEKGATNFYRRWSSGLPLHLRGPMRELDNQIEEHHNQFSLAISDLTNQRRAILEGLTDSWHIFMVQDPQRLSAFAEFLQVEDFAPLRGEVRPFLESLQTRSDKLLDEVTRGLIENSIQFPDKDLFTGFLDVIQQQNVSRSHQRTILQWLQLVSFPSLEVDPQIIADKIKKGAPFPDDLKHLFMQFLQQRINVDVRNIRAGLGVFKPERVPAVTFGLSTTFIRKPGKRSVLVSYTKHIARTEGEVQVEPERPTYQLALHGRGLLPEEVFTSFIKKTADGFASGDQRMRSDIQNMLESLKKDPFGLGVGKIVDAYIISYDGSHRLPLRRFRADQRRIPFEHEASRYIRVVFHTDRWGAPNTVIIDQILDHGEFDRRYSSGS